MPRLRIYEDRVLTPAEKTQRSRESRGMKRVDVSGDDLRLLDAIRDHYEDESRPATLRRLIQGAAKRLKLF